MWITFFSLRLSLHLGGVRHVYPGGHLVHHFFFGAILILPAAFLLAFPPRACWFKFATLGILGVASALLLDEFVYLLATQTTDADYISRLSLIGALVLTASASVLLLSARSCHSAAAAWISQRPGQPFTAQSDRIARTRASVATARATSPSGRPNNRASDRSLVNTAPRV